MLAAWTAEERAHAVWRVIEEGVRDPDVSPSHLSRRRRALHAALRLRDADIPAWRSSLTERFKQLMALREVFDQPTSTQPMEMAWKRGVRCLEVPVSYRRRVGRSKISGTVLGSIRAGCGILGTIAREALRPA